MKRIRESALPTAALQRKSKQYAATLDMKTLMSGGPQEFEEEITFKTVRKHPAYNQDHSPQGQREIVVFSIEWTLPP